MTEIVLEASSFLIIMEFVHSNGSEFTSSHFVSHFHTIILSMLVLAIYLFRIFLYYNEFLTFLFPLLFPGSYYLWIAPHSREQFTRLSYGKKQCPSHASPFLVALKGQKHPVQGSYQEKHPIPWRFFQRGLGGGLQGSNKLQAAEKVSEKYIMRLKSQDEWKWRITFLRLASPRKMKFYVEVIKSKHEKRSKFPGADDKPPLPAPSKSFETFNNRSK